MEELREKIMDARKLKASSVKAYLFNIGKLHESLYGNKDFKDLDWLIKDQKKITEILKDKPITSRKTILASIVVALSAFTDKDYKQALQKYRDNMLSDSKEYLTIQREQKKSKSEDKNWSSLETLRAVLAKYKKELSDRGVFSEKKEELKPRDFDLLQKWMVGNLYIGEDSNPPQRNVYGNMKVINLKDYNELSEADLKNNYLVVQSRNNKFFSLGDYKTEKTYNIKRIPVGKKLNAILNIWLLYNKSGYLIINSKGEMIGTNGLTKYLQRVFEPSGKSISSTMLRHIYISEKLTGPSYDEKEDMASKMSHSVATQEIYRKVD